MSGHTPGPWHASPTHMGAAYDIGAQDGSNVALVHDFAENCAREFHANARLIAEAPAMLVTLKMARFQLAVAVIAHSDGHFTDETVGEHLGVGKIDAAIARAEGRS